MSAVNNFRDTTDADILNKLRQDIESAKAGSTSQNNFTLNYISPNADTIDITDAITVNGNLQSASDTIDITDAVVQTNVNTGLFQVEDDSSYQKLWLSFDNDVVDKSGNNNSGTITGTETYVSGAISYPDGRYNKAFSFNGSSYISIPDSASLDITSSVSLSCWVYTSTTYNGVGFISKGNVNQCYELFHEGTLEFRINIGGTQYTANSGIALPFNQWNFVCGTYDGSNVRVYANAVLKATTAATGLMQTTINPLFIGALDASTYKFTGNIDDAQVWNYALSSSDITTLYNGQQIAHNGSVSPVAKVEFCDCAA